jgi:hypothetical protein
VWTINLDNQVREHDVNEYSKSEVKDVQGLWATRAKVSKGERDHNPQGRLPRVGVITAYATMQPMPGLEFPSASIGVEWMGSDSGALEVTAKTGAKKSIGVWV